MSLSPSWLYNEFQQVGTDFADLTYVETFDRNQSLSSATAEQALVERLKITSGQSVIDFGCGTGTFAIQAALAGARVYAIDVSQAMLAYAERKAQAAGVVSAIEFHHSGLLSYEHRAAPVDVVVTKSTLHHLPDFWKMVAISRLPTLLRTNGIFYLWDAVFSFEPSDYHTRIDAWIDRVAKPEGEGWTAQDFATHVREEYTTFAWILEGMLTRSGLTIETANYPALEYAEYICRNGHSQFS